MKNIIHINGYNADIDTGSEDVWSPGSSINFPAAAAATNVVSSSNDDDGAPVGTGALTVEVWGLDANYHQIKETATMNGTTAVVLSKQFFRVNGARVVTAGSGGSNAGTIHVRHNTTVIEQIDIGVGHSRSGKFTVGRGMSFAKIDRMDASLRSDITGVVSVILRTRPVGGVWEGKAAVAVGSASFNAGKELGIPLQLGEDVRLTAISSVDNVGLTASFNISTGV